MSGERYIGRDEEIEAVIGVGATTSGEIDLGVLLPVAIRTGTNLVPTTISFLGSAASGDEKVMRDENGTEMSFSVTTSITQTLYPSGRFLGARYIVVRGGTSGGVTTQTTAAASVFLICKNIS